MTEITRGMMDDLFGLPVRVEYVEDFDRPPIFILECHTEEQAQEILGKINTPSELDELKADLKEAVDALRPFAKYQTHMKDDNWPYLTDLQDHSIRTKDFKAAHKIVSQHLEKPIDKEI